MSARLTRVASRLASFSVVAFCLSPTWGCDKEAVETHEIPQGVVERIRTSLRLEDLYDSSTPIELVTPDSILLGDIQAFCVTKSGMTAVLDRANACPTVFDASGRFLLRLGRMGEGPAEFRRASAVAFHESSDEWCVVDGPLRRMIIFSREGDFRSSFRVAARVHGLAVNRAKEYFLFIPGRWGSQPLIEWVDSSGTTIKTFFESARMERNLPFALSGGGIVRVGNLLAVAHYLSTEVVLFDSAAKPVSAIDITKVAGYIPPDPEKVQHPRDFMSTTTGILALLVGPYGTILVEYGNSPSQKDLDTGKYERLLYLAFVRPSGELLGSVRLNEPISASDGLGNLYFVGFSSDSANHSPRPVLRKWTFRG